MPSEDERSLPATVRGRKNFTSRNKSAPTSSTPRNKDVCEDIINLHNCQSYGNRASSSFCRRVDHLIYFCQNRGLPTCERSSLATACEKQVAYWYTCAIQLTESSGRFPEVFTSL